MSTMLRTADELDELPDQAVIYDHSCQVWQKLQARYVEYDSVRYEWFKPGDIAAWDSDAIELPARLLGRRAVNRT